MSLGVALGVILVFTLGAGLQRVAGMGMGMVAAPSLALLVGPVAGVTMSNTGAVLASTLIWVAMHRAVDWTMVGRIVPLIVLGSVLGAGVVLVADTAWLNVVLGSSVLLALSTTWLLRHRVRVSGRPAAWGAGLAAGFMNTTAGVAGPTLTVYAVASRWDQRSFAATLQPIFLSANLASVASKAALGTGLPAGLVPGWVWPAVAAGVVTGITAGGWISTRVSSGRARRLAVLIAATGGVVALARGLLSLLG